MFNSTHTLVGFSLARSGLDRWAPYATWTAVVAANLPDIDILTQPGGTAAYLEYHRGITHAIVGVPVLSLILAGVMYGLTKAWGDIRVPFWKHYSIALIAMATHPVLDFTNTYGVRPFLPFSGRWYYGDILFVIDPYVDVFLLAGLLTSHYVPYRRRFFAAAGLVVMISYVAFRVELRNTAREKLTDFTHDVAGYRRSALSPHLLNPFEWTGLVETDKDVFSVEVNVSEGVTAELARIHKTAPSQIIARAMQTRSASVLLRFARFPVIHVDSLPTGYRVLFIDFRFYRETTGRSFAAEVRLDRSLKVLTESLSLNRSVDALD
jgi:inner membrane protein